MNVLFFNVKRNTYYLQFVTVVMVVERWVGMGWNPLTTEPKCVKVLRTIVCLIRFGTTHGGNKEGSVERRWAEAREAYQKHPLLDWAGCPCLPPQGSPLHQGSPPGPSPLSHLCRPLLRSRRAADGSEEGGSPGTRGWCSWSARPASRPWLGSLGWLQEEETG